MTIPETLQQAIQAIEFPVSFGDMGDVTTVLDSNTDEVGYIVMTQNHTFALTMHGQEGSSYHRTLAAAMLTAAAYWEDITQMIERDRRGD